MARFHFFDRMHLWFKGDEGHLPPRENFENQIVLSEAFYREIDEHRIPVEREVVAALANAPGAWNSTCGLCGRVGPLRVVCFGSARCPERSQRTLGSADYAQPRLSDSNQNLAPAV